MTPAQQKEYMSNYIKNQEGGYSIKQLKSLLFEQVMKIFETTMRKLQSFVPMGSELEVQRLKRAGQEVLEEPVKRQKIGKASGSGEESAEKEKELSEEELQKLLVIVPVEEVYVEALQFKYPIIDWEVYSEDTRRYWKIIRVGNHTKAFQIFAEMLKKFDRDDLVNRALGSPNGGKITGKGKIRTGKLDFEDVYFVKELKFNLFSVSQMCDKKNSVLFTETVCLILSPDFKLLDESQFLLKVPRQNNMYSFDLKNVVPSRGLTCLFAKATIDESNLWHRRLGRINIKTMNKLVRENLVRGLPLKLFENDHTCVACQKGKQHKASCKTKLVSSISQPLQMFHMDLFGPTSVRSINHKTYCLVVTDDYSRFSWVFFLATKDETSGILKTFITSIENQINHKVKIIRCDNGTEFKNNDMNQFCGLKGIKRKFSVARTPQ
ncbi:putative ribonuclease H-like domain-containing protein [Tanacetum coccineum]